MSGGHGPDHDGHGDHGHGPAELPPVPVPRMLTPARGDYTQPWPGGLLVWPFVWFGVAALLFVAASQWNPDWRHQGHEGHGEHGAHGAHGAPGTGTPGAAPHAPGAHPTAPAAGEGSHGK